MKTILRLTLLLAAASALWGTARADHAAVEALLITATNERGRTDAELAPYEATLKRILRFDTFRLIGSATTGPGGGRVSLGAGHVLELEADADDGRTIHTKVRWTAGGRNVMNTGLVLRAGVPAVLGGPSAGPKGAVYAVLLIAR